MARIGLALLIVDDKILMFKRSTHPDDINPGKYGLLGGHVKDSETPLEGTQRTSYLCFNPFFRSFFQVFIRCSQNIFIAGYRKWLPSG